MVVKIGLAIIFLILIFNFIKIQNKQKKNLVSSESKSAESLSLKLIIPKLDINAKVQLVGVNKIGDMETPSNSKDVGLFNLGPKPGEIGSAVIAGHFDDEKGDRAVFYNLNKLAEGNNIFIEDDNGKKLTFIIRKIDKYSEKYAEEVFSSNDMAHLNLITCNGNWNKLNNSYENRLVVFSDLVTEI